MNEIILILSFALALLLSLYGTPVTQRVAEKYGILDYPNGILKRQNKPVPYMGGVIIYFSFIAPVGLLFPFNKELLGILFAGSLLMVVGLFDDFKAITPGIKFLFQMVATYILIKSGIYINLFLLPPWLNAVLSFIWILTVINAFNIIDIVDGLASSVGVLTALTIFVISLYNDNFLISILSLSLAAALLGFLKFNWEPARIYLGDAGSMFIGMVIGSLVIMGDYSKYNDLAFISGILILSVPLFDLVYVIILRLLKGKNPFFGSSDHFTLRLKKRFTFGAAQTVTTIIAIQILLSAVVILNFYTTPIVTIVSTLVLILFFLILGIFLARVNMQERKTDKKSKE
jgi:UDP-GlcNAc:undecaprenyl-phosphate/decaprenyl-phosphate GlcNAc-1-phosphate transferase